MTESMKTYLIIGGVALVGYLVYKRATGPTVSKVVSPVVSSTSGTGNSVAAATANGSQGEAGFWNSLGSVGKGLNSAVSAVESTYNSAQDLFGGGSSSTNTGQGNNGTGG